MTRNRIVLAAGLAATAMAIAAASGRGPGAEVTVRIDAAADRHPISPLIYGVAYATPAELRELRPTIDRMGGNNTSRYNWRLNADNRGSDWFFESIGDDSATPGERADSFIAAARDGHAAPMMTVPTIGWVAKIGPNREKLASFSVAKYGAQQKTDQYMPDAGNGLTSDGKPLTGNDPNDADVQADAPYEKPWIEHLVAKFGPANHDGLRYYLLDNEPSLWQETHRDVHPTGATLDEILRKTIEYSDMIKSVDPSAVVVGPEEWGWSGYLYSGYDQQYGKQHGWSNLPDRAKHGGMDALPWLLQQLRRHDESAGTRTLDLFTVHFYPQGGEFGNDVSPATQLRRNRSTRALWDPAYKDETWIGTQVRLIPRLKEWVRTYYPDTRVGITEYNWGAERHINGATAQADILGIFGREGLDVAARWTAPAQDTPTFKAFKLYRNYDDDGSTFGDVSVSATVPNPDELSAFAATRTSDGALTVMVVNKSLTGPSALALDIAGYETTASAAHAWQLTSANKIEHLADAATDGKAVRLSLPAQSVTLVVLPRR